MRILLDTTTIRIGENNNNNSVPPDVMAAFIQIAIEATSTNRRRIGRRRGIGAVEVVVEDEKA